MCECVRFSAVPAAARAPPRMMTGPTPGVSVCARTRGLAHGQLGDRKPRGKYKTGGLHGARRSPHGHATLFGFWRVNTRSHTGGTLGLKVVPCRPRSLKVSKVCLGILLRLRTPISLKVTKAYALQMRVTDASLERRRVLTFLVVSSADGPRGHRSRQPLGGIR